MSQKVDFTDQVLDHLDILRKELKSRFPDFTLEKWEVCQDGTVGIRMDKTHRHKNGFAVESRYIAAVRSRSGKWKLLGDVD